MNNIFSLNHKFRYKKVAILFLVSLVMLTITGCNSIKNDNSIYKEVNTADLVVYGSIYTAEEDNDEVAEAFAVKDGKYIYVGNKDDVKQYIKEGQTEIIDITSGGLIIPGCTEGHGHYISGVGLNSQLSGINCSYAETLEVLKEKIEKENVKQFLSMGWSPSELKEKIDSGYNFAKEIEEIAPGIPVIILDASAHSAICNVTALRKAGLLENPSIRGGEIGLDINGEPNGYVNDQAVYYVFEKALINPFTEEQYKNACIYGVNQLLKLGYTNSLDAFTNMYGQTGLYPVLKKMDEVNKLKMNIVACYNINSYDFDNYKSKVDKVIDIVNNFSSTHFNPGYIKLFADGIVESGTGWISKEYKNADEGKEHGNIIWNQDELNAIVEYANRNNLLIHTHAYGDAACKSTLDAYIASNKSNNNEYRNCLAHVRNIQNEDILRAAKNRVPISENLIWHTDYNDKDASEKEIKDTIIGNIGEDYYYSGYPMKTLLDNGVIMSSSTDAPAAAFIEGSIMNVIEVATTGTYSDVSASPFVKDELLTVKEALKVLTINGAWQLGLENERGSIKEGKYADFVILDTNFLNYEGEQLRTIHNVKILSTYFEGQEVYCSQ